MNELTKNLVDGILNEDKQEVVALYAGGFKPPTSGHFQVVEEALKQYPEIDKLIVLVGSGVRDGIEQAESILVWEIYQNYLPMKVEIQAATKPPIRAVYSYAGDNPGDTIYWILGARDGKDEDLSDIATRTAAIDKAEDKYNNVEVKIIKTPDASMSGTNARKTLLSGNREAFYQYLPSQVEEKEEIFNILRPAVNELEDEEIGFWAKHADIFSVLKKFPNRYKELAQKLSGERKIALNYFWDNYFENGKALLNENASYSKDIDIKDKIDQLTQHMIDKGYNIEPLPTLKFVDGDSENARDFFGKTAYYDPNTQTIVLYTEGRHPKDIARSYAHEMIHHIQNLEGRLGNITTTNTQEDDYLNDIEAEANLKGTMTFRNWTDSLNEIGDASAAKLEWDPAQIEKIAKNLERRIAIQEDGTVEYYDMSPVISVISYESRTRYRVTVDASVDKPEDGLAMTTLRVDFTTEEGEDDIINKGEQYKILATLTDIIIQLITRVNEIDSTTLDLVKFYAKDDTEGKYSNPDSKRGKLYQAFINKNLSKLPGNWQMSTSDEVIMLSPSLNEDGQKTSNKNMDDYKKSNNPSGKVSDPFGLNAFAYELARLGESDPKKGTGKKPKGSGRRLYTDEDPKDTVGIKFSTRQDIVDTLNKTSFKAKSHARQSQIINLIHQRVRAAYSRAKDPDVKRRLKTALDYAEQRKEASKEKTQRLKKQKLNEQKQDMKFKVPKLNYSYTSLQPYIDKETMEEHFDKHFKGYTDKLNAELDEKSIRVNAEDQIQAIQIILGKYSKNNTIRNNGGGFYNHVLYFENMTPDYKAPSAKFKKMLEENFNSFSEFKEQFKEAGLKQFGSGWVFLIKKGNKLVIESYANQDNPYLDKDFKGEILIAMDVWEHSYYLKHKSQRGNYINDFFRVVDYKVAEDRLKEEPITENVAPNHDGKSAPFGSGYDKVKEGDTIEKYSAKGKKTGKLKQGTVRARLNIPKDEKIPISKINKELSRLKKMDQDDDKKGVQLGDKNQKYYKALLLAKTLKTTTNVNEGAYDSLVTQLTKTTINKWVEDSKKKPIPKKSFVDIDIDKVDGKGREIEFNYVGLIEFTNKVDGYEVDGTSNAGEEDDKFPFIATLFKVNPKVLPQAWSKISADVSDVIRHEIEHLTQTGDNLRTGKYMDDDIQLRDLINKAKILPQSDYYKLEKEVDAMLQGLYLKAKKTKKPFKDVIKNYLDIAPGLEAKEDKELILNLWRSRRRALSLPVFENEEKVMDYKIFLDMDGVLVDFDRQFEEAFGMPPREFKEGFGTEMFWKKIEERGVGFWRGMEWMPGGQELYNRITQHDHYLLSSPSKSNTSKIGKHMWKKDNTPNTKLILSRSYNKKNYADKSNILIDDREDNIQQWVSAGGIGILYKSAEQVNTELDKLGL